MRFGQVLRRWNIPARKSVSRMKDPCSRFKKMKRSRPSGSCGIDEDTRNVWHDTGCRRNFKEKNSKTICLINELAAVALSYKIGGCHKYHHPDDRHIHQPPGPVDNSRRSGRTITMSLCEKQLTPSFFRVPAIHMSTGISFNVQSRQGNYLGLYKKNMVTALSERQFIFYFSGSVSSKSSTSG